MSDIFPPARSASQHNVHALNRDEKSLEALYSDIKNHFHACPREQYDWANDIVYNGSERWNIDILDVYLASAIICGFIGKSQSGSVNNKTTSDAALYLVNYLKDRNEAERLLSINSENCTSVAIRMKTIIENLEINSMDYAVVFHYFEQKLPDKIVQRYINPDLISQPA